MVPMSKSDDSTPTPKDADIVVKREKNQVYNPAVSTEEVAEELEITPEEADELLEEALRPESKEVGGSKIWW